MHKGILILILFLIITSFMRPKSGEYVWIEGEKYKETNWTDPSRGWAKGDKPSVLSAGDALSMSQGAPPPNKTLGYFVKYQFEIEEPAYYYAWIRVFYMGSSSPFKFRFDDKEWKEINNKTPFIDNVGTGKFRAVCWVNMGKVKLGRGKHILEIRITDKGRAATFLQVIDCIVISKTRFTPSGKMKPDFSTAARFDKVEKERNIDNEKKDIKDEEEEW